MYCSWTPAELIMIPATMLPVLLLVRCRKAWAQLGVCVGVLLLLGAGGAWAGAWYATLCAWAAPVLAALSAMLVLAALCWSHWGRCCVPQIPDSRYPQGKVLVLAPHQDDELLLAGGILEDLALESEVHVLFSTNGDFTPRRSLSREKKGRRLAEACRAMQEYGIPAERVHFMGFGNEWQPERSGKLGESYLHLYHAAPDAVQQSFSGESETWGTSAVPCLQAGVPYTRTHFVQMLRGELARLRPDTIICVDYDVHADHRALSLLFEEALAAEMKADASYAPFVLKTFAYSCCWNTPRDFYRPNLLSTPRPMQGDAMCEMPAYLWSERLRVPVSRSCITRVLPGNILYESYMQHESQAIPMEGVKERMINGDKVYWWRPTGNLLLQAQVQAESGDAAALHDFHLCGAADITNPDELPTATGWFPEPGKARAHFTLAAPSPVAQLRLHAVGGTDSRIDQVRLTLSNGTQLELGPLPPNGSALVVDTGCADTLTGFSLELVTTSGPRPGLAEVEAYAEPPRPLWRVAKLQDADGHFMYDYTTPSNGELCFSLYTWPDAAAAPAHRVCWALRDEVRELRLDTDGLYHLSLHPGEEGELQVYSPAGSLVDAVRVCHASALCRMGHALLRKLDKRMRAATPRSMAHYYRYTLSQLFQ
ncbi:MAG: PIG-L family deacetylase [Akkermansia sp.]|nr:PIG-L family deacetylase [Akkermansia sp.]